MTNNDTHIVNPILDEYEVLENVMSLKKPITSVLDY